MGRIDMKIKAFLFFISLLFLSNYSFSYILLAPPLTNETNIELNFNNDETFNLIVQNNLEIIMPIVLKNRRAELLRLIKRNWPKDVTCVLDSDEDYIYKKVVRRIRDAHADEIELAINGIIEDVFWPDENKTKIYKSMVSGEHSDIVSCIKKCFDEKFVEAYFDVYSLDEVDRKLWNMLFEWEKPAFEKKFTNMIDFALALRDHNISAALASRDKTKLRDAIFGCLSRGAKEQFIAYFSELEDEKNIGIMNDFIWERAINKFKSTEYQQQMEAAINLLCDNLVEFGWKDIVEKSRLRYDESLMKDIFDTFDKKKVVHAVDIKAYLGLKEPKMKIPMVLWGIIKPRLMEKIDEMASGRTQLPRQTNRALTSL